MCCLKKPFRENEYELYAGWIYYVSEDGFCSYRGNKAKLFDNFADARAKLDDAGRGCLVKRPYWDYEKEFRIVVRFNQPVKYKRIALKFNVKDRERGIRLLCGPELEEKELFEIIEEFKEYGIMNIGKFTEAKIHMGLK